MTEHFWDDEQKVSVTRHIVIDAASGEASIHADAMLAYTDEDYRALFVEAGFSEVDFCPSLTGDKVEYNENLMVIAARK